MEDVHTFQNRHYCKAASLKRPPFLRQVQLILETIPVIVPKVLILLLCAIFSMICFVYRLIVPQQLKSIQGQVAAVSEAGKPKTNAFNLAR